MSGVLRIGERYQVLRTLGKGTTGTVHAAWDHRLDREVAIKLLHPEHSGHQEICGRFEQEIRITARLQHPGVVAVYEDHTLADGRVGYVMALAIGDTLEDWIDARKRSEARDQGAGLVERLTLFERIVDIISYAHSQGVVHRDLKPANIVLGTHGEVRVLDWGLARELRRPNGPEDAGEAFDDLIAEPEPPAAALPKRTTAATVLAQCAEDLDQTPTIGHPVLPEPVQPTLQPLQPDTHDERSTQVGSGPRERESRGGSSSSLGSKPRSNRYDTGRSTRGGHERSTHYGAVLGSPAYMSPEQAKGEAGTADERADIYSLGVILFEMLTLRTPVERLPDEALLRFIQRVQRGERKHLVELWPEAPPDLERVCEWALALEPKQRFPDCETFKRELRAVLDRLSASVSELERRRLEEERQATWLQRGSWNFSVRPGLEPFTEPVIAFESEAIGQVMHPELGGLLLGGPGLQVYPMAVDVSDEVRITIDLSVNRGREFAIFARGAPPGSCYGFRVGSYAGRWLSVVRSEGNDDIMHPMLLTMRALVGGSTARYADGKPRRHSLIIEAVGSTMTMSLNGGEPLLVQDPCPLSGPLQRQVAIGTVDSQIVVHAVHIEQRRSPVLVPSHAVANELLRQKLYPQAIEYYRRFLVDHPDSAHTAEAHFMLCLAFLQAGHRQQAERELRSFLSERLEHPLAQDAIYELARLAVDGESGAIERAVRIVLSYQESGDLVRSRFCLWVLNLLSERILEDGLDAGVEDDLARLRHLIRGFADEDLLLDTVAVVANAAIRDHAAKLVDLQAYVQLQELSEAMHRCRELGYGFRFDGLHAPAQYLEVVRAVSAVPSIDPKRVDRWLGILGDYLTVRDLLCIAALGAGDAVLEVLLAREPEPALRLLRAGLLARSGQQARAEEDLQHCFRLMDIIEVERTSEEITAVARLAFFGLGYLPWEVVWEPIVRIQRGQELQALAAWLAESLGHVKQAAQAYQHLLSVGSGFRAVAEQGMARLGLKRDSAE